MFGLAEMIHDLINPSQFVATSTSKIRLREVFLSWADFRRTFGAMVRCGLLRFFIGVLPGAGATIDSFLSYGLERRAYRKRRRSSAPACSKAWRVRNRRTAPRARVPSCRS